ncbi:MAG: hypothetical protein LVQ95_04200 [Candidatus Micrarchaeales archaeon]|nr:hypothetical protein [Candidatus Micrarchaeales archaeon]
MIIAMSSSISRSASSSDDDLYKGLPDSTWERIYPLSDRGIDESGYDGPTSNPGKYRSFRHEALSIGRETIAMFVKEIGERVLEDIAAKQKEIDERGLIRGKDGTVAIGIGLNGYDIYMLKGLFYGRWSEFYEYFKAGSAELLLNELRQHRGSSVFTPEESCEGHEEPSW